MNKPAYKLTVGCDPEIFLKKGRMYQSAHGVIPGDKYNPFPVRGGAVQVDGMAVEFNITPAGTSKQFQNKIKMVMNTLGEMIGEHKLAIKPSAQFNPKVWKAVPEEAKILGCDPDYNAWTSNVNPKPNNKVLYRTAAGHVHIGWTNNEDIEDYHHINECETVVKELDIRLGIPSLLIDTDERRRKLYGKAGAYRPKPYGVEYRVLSNFWLLSPLYQDWVFRTVQKTLDDLYNGIDYYSQIKNIYSIERTINLNQKGIAKNIVQRLNLEVPNANA